MWFLLALGASAFWGVSYVISEQTYKHISVLTSLAIAMTAAGLMAGIVAYFTGTLSKDLVTIFASPKVLSLVAAGILVLFIAELFIGYSIVGKNATIAGLVEISYPLFIALFSYLVFRQTLGVGTAIGGALIFAGVGIIYAFNR